MKKIFILSVVAFLSLPITQIIFSIFNVESIYITIYLFFLGSFCLYTLFESFKITPTTLSLKGVQSLNLLLGVFCLLTSSLVGISYIL